ncbi:MAG: glycosyltransferase [Actinomycetota bacterium]
MTSRLGVWSSHVQLACSKDAAAAQFGPGVAASVLPLAVSEPQESTPNRKPPAELRIGFFGRFEGRKRPELVVETVRCLVDMGVDACAELFGDGPMVGEVMAAIERNGLRDRVVIRPGTLDPVGEMTRFRVVLVPSIFEGFGLVPVEAASAGVPLVATTEVQSARLLDGPVRILEVSDSADEWAAAVREVGSAQTTYGAKTRALLAGLAPEVSAAGLDATYRALLTATDQQR